MSASLTLEALGCVRGDRLLFSALDLSLGSGDAALVTGPNGAGKTSLLRLIAGLLRPQAGSIEIDGRLGFGAIEPALDRELPLERALLYWARIDGGGAADVARALAALGLATLAEVPVRMLSTGQLKRAGLARVIASGTDIWLLDEPANGLDTEARGRLETVIADHRAQGGIAVVATHQPLAMPDAAAVVIGDAG